MAKDGLSTDPYKGVRDFYPQDQFVQRFLFEAMARACESFGYEEYAASILEPADLYRAKGAANEEIANEQTYTFTDRGDRLVTLRPEMTPTAARMVAAKRRELAFPLRWYSIPNVFRYERPQKGRLREHWQLNADLFGVAGIEAEAEAIALAHRVMLELGASEHDFEIRVNDRALIEAGLAEAGVGPEEAHAAMALLDKRAKLADFDEKLAVLLGSDRASALAGYFERVTSTTRLEQLQELLLAQGVRTMVIDTAITRGFDYYTGIVFEVFDADPSNARSLFGGGRYDRLLELFGEDPIPAVGFGMGDVTARDFLESHELLPSYVPATELSLCVLDPEAMTHAIQLASALRSQDVTVAINYSCKKPADQLKAADKLGIPFAIFVGAREVESGQYSIRQLATGRETILPANRIADHLFSSAG
ncbi:MAG TPA: histidine--tRNA ligase [Candidatus Paceibacterota bacterium]|nr:histidine--tRNA ligase [Candidatus Paceibacterota bacterium]